MGPTDETIIEAAKKAAEYLEGMGYLGKEGGIQLMDLKLQTNTVTAILHNMVAWQIGELDQKWQFKPKGGGTPDLVDARGNGIQVKATSGKKLIGNKVSKNAGFFVAIKYKRENHGVEIKEIHIGQLLRDDWERREGTQFAFLKPEAEARLRKIYP